MNITVLKKRVSRCFTCLNDQLAWKAGEDARLWAMSVVHALLLEVTIQPGDKIILDIRIKIEEAPQCEDKQQRLFDDKS